MNFLLTSCVDEPEAPKIEVSENAQLAKVKSWFEENKTKLRLPDKGTNLRTESQELILPFFEKEPDWDKFHHYFFPDGREVFEVSLENATKYFPAALLDSFPGQNPANFVIQNIMFIKHPTEDRFDPLIARYFPDNIDSKRDFSTISYDSVNEFWSGRIELFTYDERRFISFVLLEGKVISTVQSPHPSGQGQNSRITGDCFEVSRQEHYYSPIPGTYGGTVHSVLITQVVCTGSEGIQYTPNGSQYFDGYYYYNQQNEYGIDISTSCGSSCYSPPSAPDPSLFIINQLTNPCAERVFKQLSKRSEALCDLTMFPNLDFFDFMLDLFRAGGKFNYHISNGALPDGKNAETNWNSERTTLKIVINDNYLANATTLSIARTIIHETAHAYIENLARTERRIFAQSLNNYYMAHSQNINDGHHGMMSQYTMGMAVALYNWDKNFGPTGGNLDFTYYYKLAFGGLVTDQDPTQPISEAIPLFPQGSNWTEINQIIVNESTGNNQAKGIKENCIN